MTNQEAIDELIIVRNVYDGMREAYKPCVEAIDMAISALKAQDLQPNLQSTCNKLATDCISRQEAIDAVDELLQIATHEEKHKLSMLRRVLKDVLPSAQPEQHWIPCSERLPEPRTAVLGYAPKYNNIYALYYDSVMGWMIWSPIRDDIFPNSQGEIIAWMPLPECYREGEV